MLKHKRMDLIDQSTGLRKSQDKKMEASRERSGHPLRGISVTGLITARRALVSSSSRMETSMKACGQWIRSMGKALTGDLMAES